MSRTTVPRLWAEKQKAVAKMRGWNLDFKNFVSIGLAGVMSNLPIGPVVPQLPPGPPSLHALGSRSKERSSHRAELRELVISEI